MSKSPSKTKLKRSRSKQESSAEKPSMKRQKVTKSLPNSPTKRKVKISTRASNTKLPLHVREGAPSPDSIHMPPPALPVKKESPTKKESPAKTSPAKMSPAKESPAKESPAKKSPAKTSPAKMSPAKMSPAKMSPAKMSPAKTSPAKESPAKESPAKESPAKESPAKESPAKVSPVKTKTKRLSTGKDGRLPRHPPRAKLSGVSKTHASRKKNSSSKSTSPLKPKKRSKKVSPTHGKIGMPLIVRSTQDGPLGKDTGIMVFRATTVLGKRNWPVISIGDRARGPRWRIVESDQEPDARDLSLDLIKTHKMRTHIRRVLIGEDIHSGMAKFGLGALEWEFEPGPSELWNGLSKEQLYEYAYLCLLDALSDFPSRDIFRDMIARAKIRSIRNVEDPLPPPPPPPKFTYFGKKAGGAPWSPTPMKIKGSTKPTFDKSYARPSTALRRGQNPLDGLVSRMLHHKKGTRRPGEISRSLDPYAHFEPKSDSEGEAEIPSLYKHGRFDEEKQSTTASKPSSLKSLGTLNVFHAQPDPASKQWANVLPSHKAVVRANSRPHPSEIYYERCQEICADPEQRRKHFNEGTPLRVRTWAGSIPSEAQAAAFRAKLPGVPRIMRPFAKFKTRNNGGES